MARKPDPDAPPTRRMRGFEVAGGLLSRRIQKAGESRGFAITRLLTHWPEVAGPDLAPVSRPVKVGYTREGMGATLTLLVAPAHAPMVEMRKERLRERVNAVYGYNAISRIHITQTAATGFAEGQADFTHAPRTDAPRDLPQPGPAAQAVAADVTDDGLRRALAQLAQNVLARNRS
jgi:hypothetical protein